MLVNNYGRNRRFTVYFIYLYLAHVIIYTSADDNKSNPLDIINSITVLTVVKTGRDVIIAIVIISKLLLL